MVLNNNLTIQQTILAGSLVLIGMTMYFHYRKNRKNYQTERIVVVFSGKRKSGKDFITDRLLEKINSLSERTCEIGRLSGPLKKAYAEEHNLDYDQLLSDGPYKEKYRADMIIWGENKRNQDPSFFAEIVMKQTQSSIIIISDARRQSDLIYFRNLGLISNSIRCITVRVEATEKARSSRGFQYTVGVDNVESEQGLDHIQDWDYVLNNNRGDPTLMIHEEDISHQIEKLAFNILKLL